MCEDVWERVGWAMGWACEEEDEREKGGTRQIRGRGGGGPRTERQKEWRRDPVTVWLLCVVGARTQEERRREGPAYAVRPGKTRPAPDWLLAQTGPLRRDSLTGGAGKEEAETIE